MSCQRVNVTFREDAQSFDPAFCNGSETMSPEFKEVGAAGKSAYEIAVAQGFDGTVEEWLDSLKGKDGEPGKDGAPGQPGVDGYTPVLGKDYWTKTDMQEIIEEVLEQVPSGGGAAIIDVIALPTENIDEDSFYRLLTGTFVYNQYVQNNMICHCVDSLPKTGEPVTVDMQSVTAYYNVQDGGVYGYIDDALSAAAGVPVGWYTLDVLGPAFGVSWSGVITNILDDPRDGAIRLLLEYVVYSYKDGWTALKPIGRAGAGIGAEVFNHPSNTASGECSHAEGINNTASGRYSHAEGGNNKASGGYSHAEGNNNNVGGECSHAEGYNNTVGGECSHAEGYNNTVSGECSHAEGRCNLSVGRSQHVQGEYNAIDPEYDANDPSKRGKYIHIVGNGDANNRSNAHTLDWAGNAWFAGGVELTSPNGTRYRFTVTDDGTLVSSVVT